MNTGSMPPPPPSAARLGDPSTMAKAATRMIAMLAILGLAATALTTFLWLGERSAKNDAAAERDAAREQLDASLGSAAELETAETELVDVRAELETARVELETARVELDDARAALDEAPTSDEIAALEAELADERAQVERLMEENAELAAAPEPPPTTVAETDEPATDDAADPDQPTEEEPAPEAEPAPIERTPLEIGRELGGLFRNSVIGQVQQQCLGETVLAALGNDLATILASDDPTTDQRLVDAMLAATGPCAIAESALFG